MFLIERDYLYESFLIEAALLLLTWEFPHWDYLAASYLRITSLWLYDINDLWHQHTLVCSVGGFKGRHSNKKPEKDWDNVPFMLEPLKTPLVLPALYAFLPAYLTDYITNQFLAKFWPVLKTNVCCEAYKGWDGLIWVD